MIEQSLTTWLRALGATSVRPLFLQVDDAMPGITYTPVAERSSLGIDGTPDTQVSQIQIDVWALSYNDVKSLAQSVMDLNGFAGDFSGLHVGLVEAARNFEDFDAETRRYRVSIDLTIYS
ncbi:hypothetical protein Mag101_07420 [Microbulbifer agarilyticus]|uniref:DUF3168 domain-containing protein n=1 Tax=Microbulbifer agarilyticus TaxID=260552 RepID=A0A1Q2M5C0_9GAMM|nr:DUF3168 domain-containing protein [Microbulbifer agarilyticus]AQQ67487.1 hypothetical protein Mag101_07420 [Microbulbifer agarilyticus]